MFGLIAAAIWGAFIAVSNLGIETGLLPADMTFLRFSAAALVLLPFLLTRQPATLAGVGWPRAAILAVFAGPLYVLATGQRYLYAPLAHGAVIQLGVITMAGTLIAAFWFADRLTARRVSGLLTLLVGLVAVAGPSLLVAGSGTWRGDALFALAGLMFAVYAALVRHWKLNAFSATIAMVMISATVYAPIYIAGGGLHRRASADISDLVIQALVQGVLSGVVSLYAFSRAIELLGAARAALFPALAPALAMLMGIPLLGEWPTMWQWIGLAIATFGLVWAATQQPKQHAR
ncbi:DMT family transporter [Pseudoxanthomonas sp. F37]|uniref:DMT family transporter n=1 Tax=Pseudoxanthomonas TaxID=83618 RepID=UPI001FD29721|nr:MULTISPECIES: DMT family transporter [Pseudoxanthomonas]UOV05423.1 DMT family transporter [Pseudoxanthomonas mexicana]UOV07078.1 DMT family transporter [Pseudoxanthomonas sp. F37]